MYTHAQNSEADFLSIVLHKNNNFHSVILQLISNFL